MVRKVVVVFFLYSIIIPLSAQTGGDNVYEFLNLSHSGLISSLGGANVSISGNNLNLAYHNPGLLNSSMHTSLALNYVNYFAGINYGLAMYSRTVSSTGNFAAGITYLNYGSFTGSDPSGNITGEFSASEYAFSFIYSRELDSMFTIGIDFRPVISHLENYNSLGFVFDLGASWHSRNRLLSAGIVIRNAGYQLTTYAGESRQSPPFEVQAGVTAKLAHAPLRFSLTIRHLEKYDLTWDYGGTGDENANSSFFENMMRHAIIGTELILYKNFYLSAGYNYQRRSELRIESKAAAAGFSWGFGINSSIVNIEFGRATYHLAGASNHVSLILRTDQLYKRFRK